MPPAQVPRMVQQLVGNCIPLAKQRFNGAPKVNGIPQDDRCPYRHAQHHDGIDLFGGQKRDSRRSATFGLPPIVLKKSVRPLPAQI